MLATPTRSAATQLTIQWRNSTLLRLRLPSLLSTPCTSTSYATPALATAVAAPLPTTSTATEASGWSLGSLWDGILLAVPKKKVSHSRKSMRAANKGLKDRVDLVHCSACGKPKLHHHICAYCYFELNRARKVALKHGESGQHHQQQQ
ncbi:related to MRPL32-mitochondrial ribosomal protein of the large subunit [Sporisorium reilianum f. sp. reilianum]|uniref:Large ribosomal subunit protein bL32m n=1 Tax=Sporisorium reilianum f. sp. reilianum TaxID=72559 RepID=A0A2N8UHU4_9BASI|nr:related to MRPL32-mitochondrial ribosomal protein of the large subunit [Sporisorium reilianum f. sp. reilianum]